jgi:hypothetical protein
MLNNVTRWENKEDIDIKISVLNGETAYTTPHIYVSKTFLKVLVINHILTMKVSKGFFVVQQPKIVPRPHKV